MIPKICNLDENENLMWLNTSLLEQVIVTSEEDDKVQVTLGKLTRATAAGDNYGSEMYRVIVQYKHRTECKTKSLIIKVLPRNNEMAKVLLKANMFTKEYSVLSSVTPTMYKLLQEASIPQLHPFTPLCFYFHRTPDAIIMEDLKENGYKMAKRMLGLDIKHCMLVIRKLARFHASSAVLHVTSRDMFKPFHESVYSDVSMSGQITKIVFAEKLHNLANNTVDLLIKFQESDENDFTVFKHGDLWLNNMMFKYSDESGEVQDVRFVDFQLCHLGSASIDVLYFLHTSLSKDLIGQQCDLIQEYHNTLKETLASLGYEQLAPSIQGLQQELERKRSYAVIVACTVLPIILADPNNIPDFEEMAKNDESINFSEEFKATIKLHLLEFERKGWL
ncbi:hypothetical protein L9F63_023852 [Diploptera punctata]|uniref:CHK kinase-like domain-containing protein n=1 Tax=Diploptera punctata TaxID=6984 RepID=A0AAD7ZIY6_DIPPU|nr:hypothetical protein L9F63_023852 [Diploptera punctata]